MAPGTVKLRESLQQSWRIYLVLRCSGLIDNDLRRGGAGRCSTTIRLDSRRIFSNIRSTWRWLAMAFRSQANCSAERVKLAVFCWESFQVHW